MTTGNVTVSEHVGAIMDVLLDNGGTPDTCRILAQKIFININRKGWSLTRNAGAGGGYGVNETINAEEYREMYGVKTGRSKYGNRKTDVDGITFDSAAEANRYRELKLLEKGGKIEDLELQTKFPVFINGRKICDYRADFVYYDREAFETVYEDVKGMRTDVYKLKKKMVEAFYSITITEVQ